MNKINKKLIISSAVTVLLALPSLILAFDAGAPPNEIPSLSVNGIIEVIFSIIWPIAVAFFIIMFLLAAFMFATAQGDPEGIKKARSAVIWGVVGVVVALIAFSIPAIVRNTIGQGL